MSATIVIAPLVVTTAWPLISGAAVAVMTAMGYAAVKAGVDAKVAAEVGTDVRSSTRVELKLANSEELKTAVGREEELVFEKDGITVTFSRDVRGKLKICVEGAGYPKSELERFGSEIAGRVVQQYAYHRILDEMERSGMNLVEQEVDGENNIHLKLRSFEE